MYRKRDRQTDIHTCAHTWMDGWMDGGWVNGWMGGWIGEWIGGEMEEWKEGGTPQIKFLTTSLAFTLFLFFLLFRYLSSSPLFSHFPCALQTEKHNSSDQRPVLCPAFLLFRFGDLVTLSGITYHTLTPHSVCPPRGTQKPLWFHPWPVEQSPQDQASASPTEKPTHLGGL